MLVLVLEVEVVEVVSASPLLETAANGGGEIGVRGLEGLRVTCCPPRPVRSNRAFFWEDSLPLMDFGFFRIGGRGLRVFVFGIGSEFDLEFAFLVGLSSGCFSLVSVAGVGGFCRI